MDMGAMRGDVIVHEDEAAFLENFYEPAIYAILNPPADPVLRGEVEVQNYICNSCHVLDSLGWAGITGPPLNGIADSGWRTRAGPIRRRVHRDFDLEIGRVPRAGL